MSTLPELPLSDVPPRPADRPGPTGLPPAAPVEGSAPAPTVTPAPPRRRTSRVVVSLVLLVAVLGVVTAGLVASDQRDAAEAWRDRANVLEEQRDGLVDERDLLGVRLDEALDALGTSERDVAALEERVRTLAEEKARAEDTATTVQVERDVFLELSELIGEATGSLDACVSQLFELQTASVAAFNRANLGQDVEVDALNARADEVTRFCNQARSDAASAQAAADQLPRS